MPIKLTTRWRGPARRPPLRTLLEMADEFGITHRQLVIALKTDPEAPLPEMNGHTLQNASKVQWFRPHEMRAWWAKRGGK